MIVPLHAANPSPMTGAGNWTYFFPGREPVLVDAGTGLSAYINSIAATRVQGPGHVIVSHAHGDHISGATAIAARWPETRFSKYPWPERDARYPLRWEPLADGDVIAAGDSELHAVHTPGHSPDHLALWHPLTRTLLSGDLVTPGTTVVILASSGGSLAEYLRSLKRVLALAPDRLLPSHGDPIDNPADLIRRYLVHRRQREGQVLAALEAGLHSVEAIVDRIYIGLSAALVPMARESVLAHLIKLEQDGLARRDGDSWTPGS